MGEPTISYSEFSPESDSSSRCPFPDVNDLSINPDDRLFYSCALAEAREIYNAAEQFAGDWPPAIGSWLQLRLNDQEFKTPAEELALWTADHFRKKELTEAVPKDLTSLPGLVTKARRNRITTLESLGPHLDFAIQYEADRGIRNALDPTKLGLPEIDDTLLAAIEVSHGEVGLNRIRGWAAVGQTHFQAHELLTDPEGELNWYSPSQLREAIGLSGLGGLEMQSASLGENVQGGSIQPLSIRLSKNPDEAGTTTVLVPNESFVPNIRTNEKRSPLWLRRTVALVGLVATSAFTGLISYTTEASEPKNSTESIVQYEEVKIYSGGKLSPETNIDPETEFVDRPEIPEHDRRLNQSFRAFFDDDISTLEKLAQPANENSLRSDFEMRLDIASAGSISEIYEILNARYGDYFHVRPANQSDMEDIIDNIDDEHDLEPARDYALAMVNVIDNMFDARIFQTETGQPLVIDVVFARGLRDDRVKYPSGLALTQDGKMTIYLDISDKNDGAYVIPNGRVVFSHELTHMAEYRTGILRDPPLNLFSGYVGFDNYNKLSESGRVEIFDSKGQPAFARKYGATNDDEDVATILEYDEECRCIDLPTTSEGPLFDKLKYILSILEKEAPGYAARYLLNILNNNPNASNFPSAEELERKAQQNTKGSVQIYTTNEKSASDYTGEKESESSDQVKKEALIASTAISLLSGLLATAVYTYIGIASKYPAHEAQRLGAGSVGSKRSIFQKIAGIK